MSRVSNLFVVLLRESIILQGIITLMYGGALVYMLVMQIEVPKELWALNGLIIGFFFGAKTQSAIFRSKV